MGLLWFGWFGFNGGSALTDGALAANAVVNTMMCGCVAMLVWMLLERARFGRFSRLGGTTGALAGLVAITPACGYVNLLGATILGIVGVILIGFFATGKYGSPTAGLHAGTCVRRLFVRLT